LFSVPQVRKKKKDPRWIGHEIVKKRLTPHQSGGNRLKLLHGEDVGGLDVVLELGALLLDLVERDVVGDDEGDLELLDTVTDGDEGGGSPNETVLNAGKTNKERAGPTSTLILHASRGKVYREAEIEGRRG
jgi:hypothetical protein